MVPIFTIPEYSKGVTITVKPKHGRAGTKRGGAARELTMDVKNVYKEFLTVDEAINLDFETVKNLQETYSNKLKVVLSGGKYFTKA